MLVAILFDYSSVACLNACLAVFAFFVINNSKIIGNLDCPESARSFACTAPDAGNRAVFCNLRTLILVFAGNMSFGFLRDKLYKRLRTYRLTFSAALAKVLANCRLSVFHSDCSELTGIYAVSEADTAVSTGLRSV